MPATDTTQPEKQPERRIPRTLREAIETCTPGSDTGWIVHHDNAYTIAHVVSQSCVQHTLSCFVASILSGSGTGSRHAPAQVASDAIVMASAYEMAHTLLFLSDIMSRPRLPASDRKVLVKSINTLLDRTWSDITPRHLMPIDSTVDGDA